MPVFFVQAGGNSLKVRASTQEEAQEAADRWTAEASPLDPPTPTQAKASGPKRPLRGGVGPEAKR